MEQNQNNINSQSISIQEIDDLIKELKKKNHFTVKNETTYTPNSKVTLSELAQMLQDGEEDLEMIFKRTKKTGTVSIEDIKSKVIPVIDVASSSPRVFELLHKEKNRDQYTYWHNISVGIISTIIGKWLKLPSSSIDELMLAATLHDIGKSQIRSELLNKPGKLTTEEYKEVKRHALYGYDILRGIAGLPESVPLVAVQHHEREDGGGYPFGIEGTSIHLFSKIVAVADVFHAMSSVRVYHESTPFYLILQQMHEDAFGKLDPTVMLVFMDKLMQTLIGKKVKLTNGDIGRIVYINRYNPAKSVVKTKDGLLDLQEDKKIEIAHIIGEI